MKNLFKYNIFGIFIGFAFFIIYNIFRSLQNFTLDTTIYNWSWKKIGCGKNRSTCDNICPQLLLIVIAKQREIGNCHLQNLNGIPRLDGMRFIRGIYNFSRTLLLETISAPITLTPSSIIISRVSLQRPICLLMFLNNTASTSFFQLQYMIWKSQAFDLI